jgi:hypothetical protein
LLAVWKFLKVIRSNEPNLILQERGATP